MTSQDFEPTLLASLARRLLGSPLDATEAPRFEELSSPERHALFAIGEDVGISEPDIVASSKETTARLLAEIVRLLNADVLSGERRQAAKTRLGNRGDLQPREYSVTFGPDFKHYEAIGVKRWHVEDAIRTPDAVEHLFPEKVAEGDFPAISLFAKFVTPERGSPFVTMAQTVRNGATLQVATAWRMPSDLLELSSIDRPLDLLRRFVSRFGLPFSMFDNPRTNFIYYQTFALGERARGFTAKELVSSFHVDHPKDHFFLSGSTFRVGESGLLEIAMAYFIDTTAYQASLKSQRT